MHLIIANPRGFCAGVDRAVRVVDELLDFAEEPVFVRHEIVHNHAVVGALAKRGAVFVEEVESIPSGAIAVMSAHGVAPAVVSEAKARDLRVVDATCPLVTRVQLEVARHAKAGHDVIIIGHRGHVEVDGLLGYFQSAAGQIQVVEDEAEAATVEVGDPARLAYVTQTTLAVSQAERIVDVLKSRFPALIAPRGDTICYATQNRQDAVRKLAERAEVIFVVGAPHSSNSRRLAEVAREEGRRAYLIESADEITADQIGAAAHIGLMSSASAPEHLVQASVRRLSDMFPGLKTEEFGKAETMFFRAPVALEKLKKEKEVMAQAKAQAEAEAKAKAKERAEAEAHREKLRQPIRFDGLDDVLQTAADLAEQLRETAVASARVGEREAEMLVNIGENVRDRAVNEELLAEARKMEVVDSLRRSAHRAVDLGIDAVGVALRVGSDAVDSFLSTPRRSLDTAAR